MLTLIELYARDRFTVETWPIDMNGRCSLSLSRFDTDGSKKGEEEGKKLELDGKKRCSSYSSIYRAPDN